MHRERKIKLALREPVPRSLGGPEQNVMSRKPGLKSKSAREECKGKKWSRTLLRGGDISPLGCLCTGYLIKTYFSFFPSYYKTCMLFVENLKTLISKQEKIKNTLIPALGDKPCKYFGILVDILPGSPFFFFETFSFIFNYTYNLRKHSCWKHSNNTDRAKVSSPPPHPGSPFPPR